MDTGDVENTKGILYITIEWAKEVSSRRFQSELSGKYHVRPNLVLVPVGVDAIVNCRRGEFPRLWHEQYAKGSQERECECEPSWMPPVRASATDTQVAVSGTREPSEPIQLLCWPHLNPRSFSWNNNYFSERYI